MQSTVVSSGMMSLKVDVRTQFVSSVCFSSVHRTPVNSITSLGDTFSMSAFDALTKMSTFVRLHFESREMSDILSRLFPALSPVPGSKLKKNEKKFGILKVIRHLKSMCHYFGSFSSQQGNYLVRYLIIYSLSYPSDFNSSVYLYKKVLPATEIRASGHFVESVTRSTFPPLVASLSSLESRISRTLQTRSNVIGHSISPMHFSY